MDCIVHGAAKSRTQLNDFQFTLTLREFHLEFRRKKKKKIYIYIYKIYIYKKSIYIYISFYLKTIFYEEIFSVFFNVIIYYFVE